MNVTDLLSAKAQELGDTRALLTEEGTLSFAELDRAVSSTAARFARAGIKPGDAVGIYRLDQIAHLVAVLALARLGAGHFAFHDQSPRIVENLAGRMKIVAVVGGDLPGIKLSMPPLKPPPNSLSGLRQLERVEFATATDSELPYIFVSTSGTTGTPKLGLVTHGITFRRHASLGLDRPGECLLSIPDISFSGNKQRAITYLTLGGCLALFDTMKGPEATVDFIRRHDVSYVVGSPVHATRLIGLAPKSGLLLGDLKGFRMSSSLVPEALRVAIREHISPNLYIGYGITEFGAVSEATPDMVRTVPGVVGKLLEGVEAKIVDEDGAELPPRRAGKLRLKSDGTIGRYLDDPEETARVFRDGWFFSDDLAEFTEDGLLIHHGRADDMMIVDGINVYPAEIENVLLRHPAVSEAAAFPIPSDIHGAIPVAAIVVNSPIKKSELMQHCRDWLGPRAPRELMELRELPHSDVGKVLKPELAKQFVERMKPA